MTIKSGDTVRVIAGDHKGESAKVVAVKDGKAMLEGIGIITRHLRATQYNPRGGKKDIHTGINLSNLKLEKAAEAKKSAKKGDK